MAEHVCPFWIGYLLASPIRKLFEHPDKILKPLIRPGMRVLDAGSAMGFFSIPAAKLVGDSGQVICVDLQERMLGSLRKRAARAGMQDRIVTRTCPSDSLAIQELDGQLDLALAIHMVHECPNPKRLLGELAASLKPGGALLVAEPKGHVSQEMFADTLRWAEEAGLTRQEATHLKRSHTALFRKP